MAAALGIGCPMDEHSPHERTLYRVMVIGTSLAFGTLAATIVSMKDFVGGDAAFHFSSLTVVAFSLGLMAGWAFWWAIGRWQKSRGGQRS